MPCLSEPGDAAGLAAAITRLVSEPALLQKLAVNSRKAYESYFSFDRFGQEFLCLVEEVISAHKLNRAAKPLEEAIAISP